MNDFLKLYGALRFGLELDIAMYEDTKTIIRIPNFIFSFKNIFIQYSLLINPNKFWN